MKKPVLLNMSFADALNPAPRSIKYMRKTAMLLSSLLITAPGFAFAGQTALDQLNAMAPTAPEAAPAEPGTPVAGQVSAASPAWANAAVETGVSAEQSFWESFEEGANLPDMCRGVSLPLSYDYTSAIGTVGGSAGRSFTSYPNGQLALVDEVGLSLGYLRESGRALYEGGEKLLAVASSGFSVVGGVSLKGSSVVVRPLDGKKSCDQLKKLFNIPQFKTALPFRANRFADMQVGEVWKLPVSFWMGITPTVSAGYANVSLGISLGTEKEVSPSVSLYRMSESELRLRLRLDQARIISYGAEVTAVIVPLEDTFIAAGNALIKLAGPTAGQMGIDLLMPSLEKYTEASLGISQEHVKNKKVLLEFILDPKDPAQMDKLAEMLNHGQLGTIAELAKVAVKRAFLPEHDGETSDALLMQATSRWEARLGVTSSYNGVDRITEINTNIHIHVPVLADYQRVYGRDYQMIHTPGSNETLHVHENTLERSGGYLDVPFQGTTYKHNRARAVAVFNKEVSGSISQPVLKYEHFEAEMRHTKDSARRMLENANDVMRYAGAKGGALNAAATIPLNELQRDTPQHEGRTNNSAYMTFAMVVNEKGVQDIINADADLVVKAYINTLPADEKIMMREQLRPDGSVNYSLANSSSGADETVRHNIRKALRILSDLQQVRIGPGGYSTNWKQQSERLSKMISGDSKSDLKYDEVLKVLVQLTDIGNVQAEIAYYELSGGHTDVASAKEFNGDNPAFQSAGEYDSTVEHFDDPATNTD